MSTEDSIALHVIGFVVLILAFVLTWEHVRVLKIKLKQKDRFIEKLIRKRIIE